MLTEQRQTSDELPAYVPPTFGDFLGYLLQAVDIYNLGRGHSDTLPNQQPTPVRGSTGLQSP